MSIPPRYMDDSDRYASSPLNIAGTWEELGEGAPALAALAQLSSTALATDAAAKVQLDQLTDEAKTLLYATRDRGVLEVKGANVAFEAPERFLAVHVETSDEASLAFRSREKPEITVRFFAGLRELCQHGLVLHHIYRDFSLSARGFELAREVQEEEVAELLQLAQPGV